MQRVAPCLVFRYKWRIWKWLLSLYRAQSRHVILALTGGYVLCLAVYSLLPVDTFEVNRIIWKVFWLSGLSWVTRGTKGSKTKLISILNSRFNCQNKIKHGFRRRQYILIFYFLKRSPGAYSKKHIPQFLMFYVTAKKPGYEVSGLN
jgi:hypothetical protein